MICFTIKCSKLSGAWIRDLKQVLTEAGVSSEEAQQQSENAVMQIQGALVLTLGLNNTALFEQILQTLPETLLR